MKYNIAEYCDICTIKDYDAIFLLKIITNFKKL